MEQKTLSGIERKDLGKGAAGRLRTSGKIPAVVYGHAKTLPIAIDAREFSTKFKVISENSIINLSVDGTGHEVLVKDYQEDLLTGKITHIDFYAIEKGKVLRARIPLHMTGSSKGVKEGGILDMQLHEIEVECLPKDLPADIVVDITHLNVGHAIHVSDLALPAGVKSLTSGDHVVVSVSHAKAEEVSAEEAEEGAESEAAAAAETPAPTA